MGFFSPPQNVGPLSQLLSLSFGSNKTRAAEKSCKERGWAGISHSKGCPGGISVPIQCPAHFSLQDRADLPPSLLCPLSPISHSFVGKKKVKSGACAVSAVFGLLNPMGQQPLAARHCPALRQNFFHTSISNLYQNSSYLCSLELPPSEDSGAQSTLCSSHHTHPFHLPASH